MKVPTSFYPWLVLMLLAAPARPGASPAAAEGDVWKAYLEGDEGAKQELADPKSLKDGDWLHVRYTEFAGRKSLVGVVAMEEKTAYAPKFKNDFAKLIVGLSGKSKTVPNPQNYVEDLVRQALSTTNRFTMVERGSALGDVIAEQNAGKASAGDSASAAPVDSATAPKSGNILGAEFTVKTTVIELNTEKETNEIKSAAGAKGEKGFGFGDLGLKTKVAFCRLNVRVVRNETGEIIADQTVDGSCTTTGVSGGVGVGLRMIGSLATMRMKKTPPLSNAMQSCANKVAYYVATELEQAPWVGTVAVVNGAQATINGGTNVGLQEGMTLTLLAKGADVLDPETNEVIGTDNSEIGEVRIVTVQDKLSICEIVRGAEAVKVGDLVRRELVKK